MLKKLFFIICFVLLFSLNLSFASLYNEDYNLKVNLIKGTISEEDYENKVRALTTNKDKSNNNGLSSNINLSDYYIYKNEKILIDNVEFEEIHYKMKPNLSNKNINRYKSSGPENGDFKIVIAPEDLSGADWFDTLEGYGSYLLNKSTFNLIKLGSSFDSNNLRGLLTSKFIEYIENDMKGKGTAYSMDRTVYKWGQIYDHGRWENYYYGKQYEVKWAFKFMVYDDNGNLIDDKDYKYYYPNDNPIFIKASKYFRNNDRIFTMCNDRYKSNGYIIFDRFLKITKKASNWKRGIDPCYK